MDIQVLSNFLVAAREENISKAAQILHTTQPTLSRQLMVLENELGVKLFQRIKHGIYLTNEGIIFRKRAQELVNLAQKTHDELLGKEEVVSGVISVGCGELRSVQELLRLIIEFKEKNPLVRVELFSGNNEELRERIEQGTLDMGLFSEPCVGVSRNFISMKTKEQWGVYVHKDSPLASAPSVSPDDISKIPVLTVQLDASMYHILAQWIGGFSGQIEDWENYDMLYNAIMAAKEQKCAVIYRKLDCSYEDMKFVPLEPQLESGSLLAWKDQQFNAAALASFIRYVKSVYK